MLLKILTVFLWAQVGAALVTVLIPVLKALAVFVCAQIVFLLCFGALLWLHRSPWWQRKVS